MQQNPLGDSGLTVGASERIHVFETARTSGLPPPGRHYFRVSLPDRDGLASISMVAGVDVTLAPPDYGLSIGLRQRAVLARIPAADDVAFSLEMDMSHLERTKARIYR